MVFVDPKNLGYKPYWEKWVNDRPTKVVAESDFLQTSLEKAVNKSAVHPCSVMFQTEQDFLRQLFDKFVPNLIDMILEGTIDGRQGERLKMIVPLTNLNMVS